LGRPMNTKPQKRRYEKWVGVEGPCGLVRKKTGRAGSRKGHWYEGGKKGERERKGGKGGGHRMEEKGAERGASHSNLFSRNERGT